MEEFTVRTADGTLTIALEELYGFPDRTDHWGGYSARGALTIHIGPYHVERGVLWFSTGEVWDFYTQLQKAYDDLNGEAHFESSEGQLQFAVRPRDAYLLAGKYQELAMPEETTTRLHFVARGDQSYLPETLVELSRFVATYGDNRGVPR
jgi:hypothetical protein